MINRRNFLKTAFVGGVGLGVLKVKGFSFFGGEVAFGSKGHTLGAKCGAMDILRYWKNVSEEDISLYESALQVFEADTQYSFVDLVANAEYQKRFTKTKKKLLGDAMLANLRDDAISIWLRTTKPQKVQVEYSDGVQTLFSKEYYSIFENDLAVVVDLTGLKKDSRYRYSLIIDGEKLESESYYFDSMPSGDKVRIAFGTCPHRWGLANTKLFNTIKKRNPNAMLLYGDVAVQDRRERLSLHRADYLLRDFQTAWSSFVRNVPVYASWDDHDYFSNDQSGIPRGNTDEQRRGVRQVFINSWANPYYGNGQEGIYTSFSIGKCDIIMTDNRYFREGQDLAKLKKQMEKDAKKAEKESKKESKKDSKSESKKKSKKEEQVVDLASPVKNEFLGKMQMQWLKEQLANAKGKFIILSCGTMWSDFVSNGKDSWGVFDPSGREEIFSFIEERGIKGVLLISGDRHGARIFSIERANGFSFYEFEMASLGARRGPEIRNKEWKTQLFGVDSIFAFGEFTFDTRKGKESVEMNVVDENEKILFNRTFSLSELSPS